MRSLLWGKDSGSQQSWSQFNRVEDALALIVGHRTSKKNLKKDSGSYAVLLVFNKIPLAWVRTKYQSGNFHRRHRTGVISLTFHMASASEHYNSTWKWRAGQVKQHVQTQPGHKKQSWDPSPAPKRGFFSVATHVAELLSEAGGGGLLLPHSSSWIHLRPHLIWQACMTLWGLQGC